jgi:hypothetical protein
MLECEFKALSLQYASISRTLDCSKPHPMLPLSIFHHKRYLYKAHFIRISSKSISIQSPEPFEPLRISSTINFPRPLDTAKRTHGILNCSTLGLNFVSYKLKSSTSHNSQDALSRKRWAHTIHQRVACRTEVIQNTPGGSGLRLSELF